MVRLWQFILVLLMLHTFSLICLTLPSFARSQHLEEVAASLRERIKHLDDMVHCQQKKVKHMVEEVRTSKTMYFQSFGNTDSS